MMAVFEEIAQMNVFVAIARLALPTCATWFLGYACLCL